MDSKPGCCWRCGEPAQIPCPQCQLALYCSNTCLQDDRAAHLSECEEAATAELPCANCGRPSRHLSLCARCHLAGYCSVECGELHSRLHLPACLAGRDAVLRLANQLTHTAEPFRLPAYFGNGVHALNLLKNTDQTGEEPCHLLQLSAQLPHLLRTVADISDSRRPLTATLASDSSHQLARAYLLLYLLARGAGAATTIQVLYSLRLTPEHAQQLQAALEQLVTATYSQLLQLVPWVRIGRTALSHWQEVWRAWLHAMQDAGCLARLERCRDAAMAEPETAKALERYLAALPDGQRRSAREFLLGHGTLMGDRRRRAAADCANVTLLALNPRDHRHQEAFCDLRLGSDPPAWLEAAAGADTVLAQPAVPAGALADWDRAEVTRALGDNVDPADGCRRLAEDCAEAAEARAAAGRLSVRLVQFTSLSELDEQLAELRFERIYTADAADRLGLFDVLEMAEVLLAPVPYALIVSSHRRWAVLSGPTETALSALRVSGSMTWDGQMTKEKIRLQTYLQGERLAYAARARHKDVLDPSLRVPTVPEVTSFGTLLMTNFSRQLQVAVPHKFRAERRLASYGDEMMRFLEWRRDVEGVRKNLAEQHGPAEAAAVAAAVRVGAGDMYRAPIHRGPGLYERHLQTPAPGDDTMPIYGNIRRQTGSEQYPTRRSDARPDRRPAHRTSLQENRRQVDDQRPYANPEDAPDRRPDRTQSARRPRLVSAAPLARTESLPAAQRSRQNRYGLQPARLAAPRATNRVAERGMASMEMVAHPAGGLVLQQTAYEHPRSWQDPRRPNRRRTIEIGPDERLVKQSPTESFRTGSLRVGKKRMPMESRHVSLSSNDDVILRAQSSPMNRRSATLPRSLEGMFPRLRSPVTPLNTLDATIPTTEEIYAVPRDAIRAAHREQLYAVPQNIHRTAPRHQQSPDHQSWTSRFVLSPGGAPYPMRDGQDRPRSPGTDSLSSQCDSSLTASHYSDLLTPEGRRRLTNMFRFPTPRSGRTASASSVLSPSRETSSTPPSLPAKSSTTARMKAEGQSAFSDAPLRLSKQSEKLGRSRQPAWQPDREHSNAPQTLPGQAFEGAQAIQPSRSFTLPRKSSEPKRLHQIAQPPFAYRRAPVPLPRQSSDVQRRSKHDDYAVPQPQPRRLGGTSLDQQSPAGSGATLVSSTTAEDVDGSADVDTEHQDPEASPADIDRLTQWKEAKTIGDWLRQDRTQQAEFNHRSQPAAGNARWTRSELAPPPSTSPPSTRPGRIRTATAASASEKRLAFLRSRETTEERLIRSLENAGPTWSATRPSSTDTATSEEHSPCIVSSPPHESLRSGETLPKTEDVRRSGDAILSTEDLPHGENEPQTVAELGMRDTVAAWILEKCLQEVLSEERDTWLTQLIECVDKQITAANKDLSEVKSTYKTRLSEGDQSITNSSQVTKTPVAEITTKDDLDVKALAQQGEETATNKTVIPDTQGAATALQPDSVKGKYLSVSKTADTTPLKLQQTTFSPFDVNSEEAGKLCSPRFPDVDTPVPKSIPREKFFADICQCKSPTTGERLVTLRLDASTEAPPSPGEEGTAKTPLFSSSVIIPSPERSLVVPQRIIIDVVAEPKMVQPPAIRVPSQPSTETEVKARVQTSVPSIAKVNSFTDKQPDEPQGDCSVDAVSTPARVGADAPTAVVAAAFSMKKSPKPDHSLIKEKADVFTTASNAPIRREAFKPLSLLSPDSIGRAAVTPSGYHHRSPVEEPYPVLGDDLSSRRARLEARAAAQERSMSTCTDHSSSSDSYLDQSQLPSRLSDLEAVDTAGETAPLVASADQDDGRDADPNARERLERDESDSDPGCEPESANMSATFRSSLHIPVNEQTRDDCEGSQLQELLIKFPLVTLGSGEPQAGQPDVIVTSPRHKAIEATAKQSVTQTPDSQDDASCVAAEEPINQILDNRGNASLVRSEPDPIQTRKTNVETQASCNAGNSLLSREETLTAPSERYQVKTAEVSADDNTPPPLPLSPPPNAAAKPPNVIHGLGDVMDPSEAVVDIVAEEVESDTVKEVSSSGAAKGNAVTAGPITVETKDSVSVAEDDTEVVDDGIVTKAGGKAMKDGPESVKDYTGAVFGGPTAIQRLSESGKQGQRMGNPDRRRLSRKLSMDKEFHDMKRKLMAANVGLVRHQSMETEYVHTENRPDASHPITGQVSESHLGEINVNTAEDQLNSKPVIERNRALHPGSFANARRKSRPLSMDTEYYAMKSKLQVHNGHSRGQQARDSAANDVEWEGNATSTSVARETGSKPGPAPVDTDQTHTVSQTTVKMSTGPKHRRSSGRLSMDKEFLAMRAALHHSTHNGPVSDTPPLASTVSKLEPEDPPSPPASPVSGVHLASPKSRRDSNTLSIEQELLAIQASRRVDDSAQLELEHQSLLNSPCVQTGSETKERHTIVSKEEVELKVSANRSGSMIPSAGVDGPQIKKQLKRLSTSKTRLSPVESHKLSSPPSLNITGENPSAAPPANRRKSSLAARTDSSTPGYSISPVPATRNRCNVKPLPLDPELLALRVQSERPLTGPVPQSPLTSSATPPSSPTSVLSRTGRQGSIRKRVRQLEHSASMGGTSSSPQQQAAPAPFSRTDRPGSVRDKIRRMEMLQRNQAAVPAPTGTEKESPVAIRRHSTHSPFTRLGSGDGGGVSSLTVCLQPSPPAAAHRGSLSSTGSQSVTPIQQREAQSMGSFSTADLGSESPNISEASSQKPPNETIEIPEQPSENIDGAPGELSEVVVAPSGPEPVAESSPVAATPQSPQATPPKPSARSVEESPSPPNLVDWPWTAENGAAEVVGPGRSTQDEQAGQNSSDPRGFSPEGKASSKSGNSSPSTYETANESSFSPRASVSEQLQAARVTGPAEIMAGGRVTGEGQEASVSTEMGDQDDDVFTDVDSTPGPLTTTVTSL